MKNILTLQVVKEDSTLTIAWVITNKYKHHGKSSNKDGHTLRV